MDLRLHCRQHHLHMALLCPMTGAVSNAGDPAALQLVLQIMLDCPAHKVPYKLMLPADW